MMNHETSSWRIWLQSFRCILEPMLARLTLFTACALAAAAQTAPDEIRVGARSYIAPGLRLRVQADFVQLGVVVRDGHGQPIAGLKKSDFQILDEGKPRAIEAFSIDARSAAAAPGGPPAPGTISVTPPRSVMLFFDDIHEGAAEFRRIQIAAENFVKTEIGANTGAAVFTSSAGLVADFTPDAAKLHEAIERLRSHQRIGEAGIQPCPRISPYQAYLIANNMDPSAMGAAVLEARACSNTDPTLSNPAPARGVGPTVPIPGSNEYLSVNDPIYLAVQAQAQLTWQKVSDDSQQTFDRLDAAIASLGKASGTRILLLVSEGFLASSLEEEREASLTDRALRAGIVVNALDAKGLWSEAPVRPFNEAGQSTFMPLATFQFEASTMGARNSAVNGVMARFAAATGGLFFHNSNDLTGGIRELVAVPQVTYLLSFRPDPNDTPGKYHKLKVKLASGTSGYVQTRPGYFAPASSADLVAMRERFDKEAIASDTLSEFPIDVAGRLGKMPTGEPLLTVIMHVDLAPLEFFDRNGRQAQDLRFVAGLFDAQGNVAVAREGAMELALTEETSARLTASGVNASLLLTAPPGKYRLRVTVQEATGRIAAINRVIDLSESTQTPQDRIPLPQ